MKIGDRDRAWQRLVRLVMDSRWDWRHKMADAAGMPFSRVRALDRLTHGPMTLGALAGVIGTDAPAASVIVSDLETRGLVARQPHPQDKRAKMVSLTAAGRRVLDDARAVVDQAPPLFDALGERDVAALLKVLDRLGA